MTDQEKRDLSLRMATLAEQAGLPGELAWEPARECPNGHDNYENECGAPDQATGEACVYCEAIIGRGDALDLTNPTNFLTLVEAWLTRMRTWRLTSSWHWEGHSVWMSVMELLEDGVWSVRFVARDPDRSVAEATVLRDAMEAEKGASL